MKGVQHQAPSSEAHTELLQSLGVSKAVEPAKECAQRVVHTLGANFEDFIALTKEFGVASVKATAQLTVKEFYENQKVTVLTMRRGNRVLLEPSAGEEIRPGDTLIVAGKDEDLRALPGI